MITAGNGGTVIAASTRRLWPTAMAVSARADVSVFAGAPAISSVEVGGRRLTRVATACRPSAPEDPGAANTRAPGTGGAAAAPAMPNVAASTNAGQ